MSSAVPCTAVAKVAPPKAVLKLRMVVVQAAPVQDVDALLTAAPGNVQATIHAEHTQGPGAATASRVRRLELRDRGGMGRHSRISLYCYDRWAEQLASLEKGAAITVHGCGEDIVQPAAVEGPQDHPFCLVLASEASGGTEAAPRGDLRVIVELGNGHDVPITRLTVGQVRLQPPTLALSTMQRGAGGTGLPSGASERAKRRAATPSPSYSYVSLQEGVAGTGLVNINVAVIAFSAPKKTKRDYMCRLDLVDQSHMRPTISVNAFMDTLAKLPNVKYVGDVVRAHRLQVQTWRGQPQLVGYKKAGYLVARGWRQSPRRRPLQAAQQIRVADLGDLVQEGTEEGIMSGAGADKQSVSRSATSFGASWGRVARFLPDAELELEVPGREFAFTGHDARRLLRTWHWAQTLVATTGVLKSDQTCTLGSLPPALDPHAPPEIASRALDATVEVEVDLVVLLLGYRSAPLPDRPGAASEFVTDDTAVINAMWSEGYGPSIEVWDGTGAAETHCSASLGAMGNADIRPRAPWQPAEVQRFGRRLRETAQARPPTLEECGLTREADDAPEPAVPNAHAAASERYWIGGREGAAVPAGRRLRICLGSHWKYMTLNLGAEVGDWLRIRGVFISRGVGDDAPLCTKSAWIRPHCNIMLLPDYALEVQDIVRNYAHRLAAPDAAASSGMSVSRAAAAAVAAPALVPAAALASATASAPGTSVTSAKEGFGTPEALPAAAAPPARRNAEFYGRKLRSLGEVWADPAPAKHVVKVDLAGISPPLEEWESWIVGGPGSGAPKQLLFEVHLEDDTAALRATCSGASALHFLNLTAQTDADAPLERFVEDPGARERIFDTLKEVMGTHTGQPLKFYIYLESWNGEDGDDEGEDGDDDELSAHTDGGSVSSSPEKATPEAETPASQGPFDFLTGGGSIFALLTGDSRSKDRGRKAAAARVHRRAKRFRVVSTQLQRVDDVPPASASPSASAQTLAPATLTAL